MNFVGYPLANGSRIKVLAIVDDFNKEDVDLAVDFGISNTSAKPVIEECLLWCNPRIFTKTPWHQNQGHIS